jgi:beta-lactamase regulating signal transducer with metallopeptidase domain
MIGRLLNSALPSVVTHLWISTIFLLLILIVILTARRHLTAGARHSLALIGIVKFAIPTAAVMPLIRLWFSILPKDSSAPLPFRALGGAFRFDAVSVPAGSSWLQIVCLLWMVVAAVLIIRFTLIRHRLVSLSVRTALPPEPREVDALTRARRRAGVRRSVDLARSPIPEAPAVLRIFRPLILLPPRGCDDLSDDELESLLCHECAHVARNDNLLARIESLICALFWFHPLIWIAQRITAIEREQACDEVVANSADERETFLAALTKFCQAAIAPRLPGVSCMATARLKERMDHVMNYAALKEHSPSPRRVTFLAAAFLVLFTITAGFVGDNRAFADAKTPSTGPYSIKVTGTRSGELVTIHAEVRDNRSQKDVASIAFNLNSERRGNASSSVGDAQVAFDARPDRGDLISVDVTIEEKGKPETKATIRVSPIAYFAEEPAKYTGRPISINLKDADLKDVIGTFAKLTGTEMQVDPAIEGRVTVNWVNVPWDEAFDSLLKDNNLTYRKEGKVLVISHR